MRDLGYQTALIVLGVVSTIFFGVFFWREIYPEYRIYQNIYEELEEFRSSYTGEPPPDFQRGIKQIVIEREDKGPAIIDRCTSCHVAVQFPAFSPTKIEKDINGHTVLNEKGFPKLVANEEYVWGRLDAKIKELRDAKVNEQLTANGETSKVKARLKEAEKLSNLKSVEVGELTFDVTKVLAMHPLIGNETRPFEFHPLEEYGCTSCHSGNGRGLTTVKAHGPVFDEQYEIEFEGPKPQFLEVDQTNDPTFAKMFNHKPGSGLLFQTTPILIGGLIQSKCVQCHQLSENAFSSAVSHAGDLLTNRAKVSDVLQKSYENEKQALLELVKMKQQIQENGIANTLQGYQEQLKNYALPPDEYNQITARDNFLKNLAGIKKEQVHENPALNQTVIKELKARIIQLIGSSDLSENLQKDLQDSQGKQSLEIIDHFVASHLKETQGQGTLFRAYAALNLEKEIGEHAQEAKYSFSDVLKNQNVINKIQSDVDLLTGDYQKGKQLYVSQACYACHRIAGVARGGVGPELTNIGKSYPWYIKESIVWPQADLKTSTMPNFRIDHSDLEPLMTYLLAQVGSNQSVSNYAYKANVQQWEAGKKTPIEMPIKPSQIQDLRYSMTVFATEGCAACHRLKGYESNVGFAIEKGQTKPELKELLSQKNWFENLFPEMINGSEIVEILEKHGQEIDQRIVDHVRENGLLEEIEKLVPGIIESFYSNFQYAARAKNQQYQQLLEQEIDPLKKQSIVKEQSGWKERVRRVLMMYVQEYGLGRLIGPKPSWSGVWRSDEWLMEHFYKPTAHVARSIMPVMPFDTTKFYALTYMLDVLAKQNRDQQRAIWEIKGFSPEKAVQIHCAQCHGANLAGDGPVAEWIYPIPKNLRNGQFLRNLTKERVIDAITRGVKGTPMPPLGEAAMDKPMADGKPVLSRDEIIQITDWLFTVIPGSTVIRGTNDVPKWQYNPEDVLKELEQEGSFLKGKPGIENESTFNLFKDKIFSSPKLPYQVSLNPLPNPESEDNKGDIPKYFDVIPNPIKGSPEKYLYYIKKNYYTPENIEKGKLFFEINCAVCHGSEGDGSGIRAGVMREAKPRMLTNLDWIQSRDDLRLLRSIKYGVAGTSMTPWGDLTSSLQRMQLVMFIRSLSAETEKRNQLSSAIYQTFGQVDQLIETARIKETEQQDQLQKAYFTAKREQESLALQTEKGQEVAQKALAAYQMQLTTAEKLQTYRKVDQELKKIKDLVSQESKLYNDIGVNLITKDMNEAFFQSFYAILTLLKDRYQLIDHHLNYQANQDNEAKIKTHEEFLIQATQKLIEEYARKITLEKGKLNFTQQEEILKNLKADLESYEKLRIKLISNFEEGRRLRKEEEKAFASYQKALKNNQEAKESIK